VGDIFLTGTDEQMDVVLSCNPVPKIGSRLLFDKVSVRKNALWALSNMAVINTGYVKQILSHKNVIKTVLELTKDNVREKQKKACDVLVNMALGGNEELKRMMKLGLFDALVELLGETDASVLKIVLEGVKRFLSYGDRNENNEGGNRVAERLKEVGGVEKL